MKEDLDWMLEASCRNWSQNVFYWDSGSRNPMDPEEQRKQKVAKAICRRCPVRRQCLEYALAHEQPDPVYLGRGLSVSNTPAFGVWGGFTAAERHRKDAKHLETHRNANERLECSQGRRCAGCRPIDQWAAKLLEEAV